MSYAWADPLDTGRSASTPSLDEQLGGRYEWRGSRRVFVRTHPGARPSSPDVPVVEGGPKGGGASRADVVRYWMFRGAPRHVAEGIADRTDVESGSNPGAYNPNDKGSPSAGTYQHHGDRLEKLQQQPNWQDPKVQNDFSYREVTGGDAIATKHWPETKNAPDRATAAKLWDRYFERSADSQRAGGPVLAAGNWRVSDRAIAADQRRRGTDVVHMSPSDYLDLVPEIDENRSTRARRSLAKSLDAGDEIESIPSLDVRREGGRLKVFDQDGRNRARAAEEAGVDLIPVAVNGAGGAEAKRIEGMRGGTRPYDFKPVPQASAAPPDRAQQVLDRATKPADATATNVARATAMQPQQGETSWLAQLGSALSPISSAQAAETRPAPAAAASPDWADPLDQPRSAAPSGGVFYNDAGQPFTAGGGAPSAPSWADPLPSAQPAAQPQQQGFPYDAPGWDYGNILPMARNQATGAMSFAVPEAIRSPLRGMVGMGQRADPFFSTSEAGLNPDRRQLSR